MLPEVPKVEGAGRPAPRGWYTGHMRSLAVLVVAAASLACSAAAHAAEPAPLPLTVRRDVLETVFAESLTFRLDAEATEATDAGGPRITGIVLRFVVGDEAVRNRRVPEFAPGARVSAVVEDDLVRGQVPPTAEIAWWWELTDAGGRVAQTPRRTQRYMDEAFDWRSLDGDVRVWYYGDGGAPTAADRARAAEAQAEARSALAKLEALIGALPEETVELVLYRQQADLRRAMMARGDVYEARLATLGARVSRHVVLLDWGSISRGMGRDALGQVLHHELSHVVLHLRLGRDWIEVPTWLDEGLAMFAEGPLGGAEAAALEGALEQDDLMSVRSLTSFPGDATRVTQAYGQSRDFVAYLIESGGEARFRELLTAHARGTRRFEDSLEAVYGFDQLGMYNAYRDARGLAPAAPADQEDTP